MYGTFSQLEHLTLVLNFMRFEHFAPRNSSLSKNVKRPFEFVLCIYCMGLARDPLVQRVP